MGLTTFEGAILGEISFWGEELCLLRQQTKSNIKNKVEDYKLAKTEY